MMMKAHIGIGASASIILSLVATPANVRNSKVITYLLTGKAI